MKRACVSCGVLLAVCGSAMGGTVDYTWLNLNLDWTSSSAWSLSNGPAPAFPSDFNMHSATIAGSAATTAVVSTSQPAARVLSLSNPAALVRIVTGGALTVGAGGVTGPGDITIDASISTEGVAILSLPVGDTPTLSGVVLTMIDHPTQPNRAILTSGSLPIVVASNAEIRGSGYFNAYVTNNGLIAADRAGERITVPYAVTNHATMAARSGGRLSIASGQLANTGGTIEAAGAGSIVELGGASIIGGVLATSDGGLIRTTPFTNATLINSTVSGEMEVMGGSAAIALGGTLDVNGSITIGPDAGAANLVFQLDPTVITGPGEIVMEGTAGAETNAAISTGSNVITAAADLTIRGAGFFNAYVINRGLISADKPGRAMLMPYAFTNTGTIEAAGGDVWVSTTIDQTDTGFADGQVRATAGTVFLQPGCIIEGGSISATAPGSFEVLVSAVLRGLAIQAPISLENSAVLYLSGTVQNNASIDVGDGVTGATLAGIEGAVQEIGGTGTVTFHRTADNPFITQLLSGANTIVIGPGQVFRGTTYFNAYVENRGRLAPGLGTTPGEFRLDYAFTAAPTSVIDLELFGPAESQQDRITGNSPMTLGGTLKVRKGPGFNPPVGSIIDVIRCGVRSGLFAAVDAPGFEVLYQANGVQLIVLASPCGGADFNNDGIVNTGDLTFFLGRFGSFAPVGSQAALCDFNSNGIVDTPDLVFFIGRFGSVCP